MCSFKQKNKYRSQCIQKSCCNKKRKQLQSYWFQGIVHKEKHSKKIKGRHYHQTVVNNSLQQLFEPLYESSTFRTAPSLYSFYIQKPTTTENIKPDF